MSDSHQSPVTSHQKKKISPGRSMLWFFVFSVVCGLWSVDCAQASSALEEIPVQHNGRVKPFQSFAREAALQIVGKIQYENRDAVTLVWSWIANPEEWSAKAMIPVPRAIQKEFGIMLVKGRLSPQVIQDHKPFVAEVQLVWAKKQKKEKLTPAENYRIELYNKAELFQSIASGAIPGFIPHPENPKSGWLPLQMLSSPDNPDLAERKYSPEKLAPIGQSLGRMIDAFRRGPKTLSGTEGQDFSAALRGLFESRGVFINKKDLNRELFYNRLDAFGLAWKLYLAAAVCFIVLMLIGSFGRPALFLPQVSIGLWSAAFAVHLLGFVLRCLIAGRPPVTNMYESVIWVSWTAVLFSGILFVFYRTCLIPMTASLVAALSLIVAESFPAVLDPAISPLVPVLRSNLWLTIHVLTITMSYGAFFLAWGLGHVVVVSFLRPNADAVKQKVLSELLYRSLQIGVVLLAAGTILGGVWANYSWGRFWGWDPKETWALIALLGYLVVLHGRYMGWLDAFFSAASSVIAFLGILMAWYGVNYVLAAGLHSYGFGGGGAVYVMGVALADLVLILIAMFAYKKAMSDEQRAMSKG